MRDVGIQSYAWNGLAGWLAWLGDQQNLMLISMALGIITALVNMYAKCQEGKLKRRQSAREEEKHRLEMAHLKEIHELKVKNLKRGLASEPTKSSR